MKEYTYYADMGSLMVASNGARFFFDNGIGDGKYSVSISEALDTSGLEFVGHFDVVDDGKVSLHDYDCGGDVIHTFAKGRYLVYRDDAGDMYIERWK